MWNNSWQWPLCALIFPINYHSGLILRWHTGPEEYFMCVFMRLTFMKGNIFAAHHPWIPACCHLFPKRRGQNTSPPINNILHLYSCLPWSWLLVCTLSFITQKKTIFHRRHNSNHKFNWVDKMGTLDNRKTISPPIKECVQRVRGYFGIKTSFWIRKQKSILWGV